MVLLIAPEQKTVAQYATQLQKNARPEGNVTEYVPMIPRARELRTVAPHAIQDQKDVPAERCVAIHAPMTAVAPEQKTVVLPATRRDIYAPMVPFAEESVPESRIVTMAERTVAHTAILLFDLTCVQKAIVEKHAQELATAMAQKVAVEFAIPAHVDRQYAGTDVPELLHVSELRTGR